MSLLPPRHPVPVPPDWPDCAILAWMDMLGPTRPQQAEVIRDLLLWGSRDGMSKEDRAICNRALRLVE